LRPEEKIEGFCLFILIGMVFRVSLRVYRTSSDPLCCGLALGHLGALVGLLIHSLGANTFIIVRIMEPFWFLTALVVMSPGIEHGNGAADDRVQAVR